MWPEVPRLYRTPRTSGLPKRKTGFRYPPQNDSAYLSLPEGLRADRTGARSVNRTHALVFCRHLTCHLSIRAKITSASCMFRTDWLPSSAPAYRFTRATLHATYELGAEGGNRTLKVSQWVLSPPRLPVSPQPQSWCVSPDSNRDPIKEAGLSRSRLPIPARGAILESLHGL